MRPRRRGGPSGSPPGLALDEGELERGLGDCEVGVAGASLAGSASNSLEWNVIGSSRSATRRASWTRDMAGRLRLVRCWSMQHLATLLRGLSIWTHVETAPDVAGTGPVLHSAGAAGAGRAGGDRAVPDVQGA